MNNIELIERWIHKASQAYWVKHKSIAEEIDRVWKWKKGVSWYDFSEYLNALIKKYPMVEEYINHIYSRWMDISYLKLFHYTARRMNYEQTKQISMWKYVMHLDVNNITLQTHSSIEDNIKEESTFY